MGKTRWFVIMGALTMALSAVIGAEQSLSVELTVEAKAGGMRVSALKMTEGSYNYRLAATPGALCDVFATYWDDGKNAYVINEQSSLAPSATYELLNREIKPLSKGGQRTAWYPPPGKTTKIKAVCWVPGQEASRVEREVTVTR